MPGIVLQRLLENKDIFVNDIEVKELERNCNIAYEMETLDNQTRLTIRQSNIPSQALARELEREWEIFFSHLKITLEDSAQ